MIRPTKCTSCGKPLPPDAPMGLCPTCLIAVTGDTGDSAIDAARPFVPPLPEELGERFPQLEILELVGRGGMGAVYKARQKQLDRVVALKILPPGVSEDSSFAERFAREAKALAKLNHPNIVTLYEFGNSDGLYFFLMEYVEGVNLRQAMIAQRFTPEEALAIVPPVCEALQLAHESGVVHRDIKPENLLLSKDGQIKIADFGVAIMVGGVASEVVGRGDASSTAGTPRYMAPEQSADATVVDHRADIYALGVVLYELLTGETPSGPVIPPSQRIQVDVRIDEIVLRALAQEPELRFMTANEFRTQVETVVAAHPTAPPPTRACWKSWVGLILAGLSGLLGGSIWLLPSGPPALLSALVIGCAAAGLLLGWFAPRKSVMSRGAVIVGGLNLAIAVLFMWVTASNEQASQRALDHAWSRMDSHPKRIDKRPLRRRRS